MICITEPYFSNLGITTFSKKYHTIAVLDKPRAAIIITSSNIKFNIIKINKDYIVINITYNNESFILINMYSPPSSNIMDSIDILDYYMHSYSSNKIIVTGDFNAKHDLWGNQKVDSRGTLLMDLLLKYNYTLLNDKNSPPTYCTTLGSSWIDLIFFSAHFDYNLFSNFKVNDDVLLSDHRLITFEFGTASNKIPKNLYMNLDFIDSYSFAIGINKLLYNNNYSYLDNVDEIVDDITKGVQNVYASSRLKKRRRRTNAPWWNSILEIQRKRIRALRRLFQSEKDISKKEERCIIFKRERAAYKKLILKTKVDSFKNYLNNITNSDVFGSSYKIVREKYKINSLCSPIEKDDASYTVDYLESRRIILMKNFYKENLEEEELYTENLQYSYYDGDINELELDWALSSTKSNKAPGPDGLSLNIVKYLFDTNYKMMYEIINKVWYMALYQLIGKLLKFVLSQKKEKI